MKRHYVKSSVIKTVGFDADKHILEIGFHTGDALWQYADFPEQAYTEFMQAGSKGNYFTTQIRGKYPEKKIR